MPFLASPTAALLRVTLAWYLLVIGPVRHTHRLLSAFGLGAWDPSGHVAVYASQLLPLWSLRALEPSSTPLFWVATAWSCALWYLSFATGAFFHTPSETAAAWLLALWLRRALEERRELLVSISSAASTQPSSTPTSALRLVAHRDAWLHRATWAAVLPFWLLCTAAAWEDARTRALDAAGGRSELPMLGAMGIYDAALWLLLAGLDGGPCSKPAPAATPEASLLGAGRAGDGCSSDEQ